MNYKFYFVLLVVISNAISHLGAQCTITNVTEGLEGITNFKTPQIDQQSIVWTGREGLTTDASNIYLYQDGVAQELPGPPNGQNPTIHNGLIAYDASNSVYLYDGNSTIEVSAPFSAIMDNPQPVQLHNGTVVWEANRNYLSNNSSRNIFMYADGIATTVTNTPDRYNEEPQVSDDYVVWSARTSTSGELQVFAFDRINNQEIIVSELFANTSKRNQNADVDGDVIVWFGADLITNNSITYQYTSEALDILESTSEFHSLDPKVHNGIVAWSRFKNGRREIFLSKDELTYSITDTLAGLEHRSPKIHNEHMAWLSRDDEGRTLYYWEGGNSSPIELSRMVPGAQLAESNFGDNISELFDIWNDQITWTAVKDGVNQIYHADCSIECPKILTLDGTIDQSGTAITFNAADSIYSSQHLISGNLTLNAPIISIENPFEVANQAILEVRSDGCQ